MTAPDIVPLPAATIALVREAARGYEILLLQRNHQSGFMPGMFLFPGGALDPEDGMDALYARCDGLDTAAADARLGTSAGGLAYWTAAVRECFEEAGVLFAYDERGELVTLSDAATRERFGRYRAGLNAGTTGLLDVLGAENLRVAADRLTYFSNWITPVGAPRRYDTRFFVAEAPAGQDALHDNRETIHHLWIAPGAALDRYHSGEFKMRTPTVTTLKDFAEYDSVAGLIAAMRARRDIPAILPRIHQSGQRLFPGDAGYEAAGKPGEGGAWKP